MANSPLRLHDSYENRTLPPSLRTLTLRFLVSRNEEYIELSARDDHRVIELGARAHNVVLLALARSRLEDRKRRVGAPAELRARSDGSEGWAYLDDIAAQIAMDEHYINTAVFRSRRQLAAAGIRDAVDLIERRRMTGQLRIGVAQIEIEIE